MKELNFINEEGYRYFIIEGTNADYYRIFLNGTIEYKNYICTVGNIIDNVDVIGWVSSLNNKKIFKLIALGEIKEKTKGDNNEQNIK